MQPLQIICRTGLGVDHQIFGYFIGMKLLQGCFYGAQPAVNGFDDQLYFAGFLQCPFPHIEGAYARLDLDAGSKLVIQQVQGQIMCNVFIWAGGQY
ncbi:MAG: hypothetical protein RIQ52_5 [Pseudomonadota bacterium]